MFLIVQQDRPIYELDIIASGQKHIKDYFLVHSALDNIDLLIRNKREYYLGPIKNDDILLYTYVNAIQLRFLLFVGQKKEIDKAQDKNIKEFFNRANQALAQAFLNPLYRPKDPIRSPLFEQKIKNAVKQCLRQVFEKRK